jgi:isoleucyl-tRNA synthetase
MADQIIEELNVKTLEVVGEDSDLFEYQVLPNLRILGPKLGGDMRRVQDALKEADKGAIAREAASGRSVTLGGIEVLPEELLVSMAGKPGYAVAEEAGYAVAVTTVITPELADEGLARELVRRVQEMRKSAGFEIADRIRLHYEGDETLARVLGDTTWKDYVSQETLATAIIAGDGAGSGGAYSEEHEIDGRKVRLAVEKV